MSKVHEAWDLVHSQIYSLVSPIPTKPTQPVHWALEQNWVCWWWLWPKWHVSMVLQYTDAAIKSILAHEQGSWSFGPGSQPDFYSNPTNCHQAKPCFGAKTEYFGCNCGQNNMCVWLYIYVYRYKVNISSWARFVKLGTWLTVRFIVQSRQFPQNQPPFLRETDKFCCCSGPKHMCIWL